MKVFRIFSNNFFRAISICLLVFIFVFNIDAQSGRKNKQATPQPAPEISKTEPETKKKPDEKVEPLYKIRVFNNNRMVGFSQFFYPDRVPVWVTERLRNSLLLDVSGGTSISQKEAKNIARESTEFYVVYVELYEDQLSSPTASRSNNIVGDVYIRYNVFEPGTGKTKHSGQVIVYSNSLAGNGNINRTGMICYPQLSNKDRVLLYSSFEAAEKIMSNFKIPIPALQCSSPI